VDPGSASGWIGFALLVAWPMAASDSSERRTHKPSVSARSGVNVAKPGK
jgi:hypothetical protein